MYFGVSASECSHIHQGKAGKCDQRYHEVRAISPSSRFMGPKLNRNIRKKGRQEGTGGTGGGLPHALYAQFISSWYMENTGSVT
jgi:hypothetical protein